VANSDERLLSVLETLEDCRGKLIASGNRECAQLLSVAMLDLRMKLNGIGDAELKALCDEMLPAGVLLDRSKVAGSDTKSTSQRRRPLLRLVK